MRNLNFFNMDDELLQQEKQALEARLDELENRPTEYINRRQKMIDDALKRVKQKTTPVHKGNITMYQHLQNLKSEWAKERREGGFVDTDKQKTQERLDRVNKQLEQYGY